MIRVNAITKTFGTLRAVDNVDLHVRDGEFLSLLGPSGCGKTTLLRLIAGFESADSGTILLNNQDVTNLPPYKRDVTQVFQSYALFPHMTIWANVAFGLRMRGFSRREQHERVAEALRMVSLEGQEAKKPRQLSGGQQQRVALARAIVCRPKVLLLDEPLSALDAKLRQSMQLELRQLHRQLGMTFVFVTHDQAEALTMSDRVAVMNAGKIEQIGTPAEIYSKPQSTFVANFVGQANIFPTKAVARIGNQSELRVADAFTLMAEVEPEPQPGDEVQIMIRPEKMLISPTRTSERDFQATIIDKIFAGPTTRLRLRGPNDIELIALTAHPPEPANATVFITIGSGDVHVLKD